jgi:surface polysaccharide O-acyltransferase-like enzyme
MGIIKKFQTLYYSMKNYISHIITKKKIYLKYRQFKELGFLNTLVFWHNNGYSFISGFVGYKTNKYSNLFYLWICVFFYSVIIYSFYFYYKPKVIRDQFYNNLFPIIFERYWFFSSYFGMYLFLPIINKGIAYLNKHEFKICLTSIIYIFVVWHDIMNLNHDTFRTNRGYSVLWLLTFYITGAYFGKFKIILFGIKKFCFCLFNFLKFCLI